MTGSKKQIKTLSKKNKRGKLTLLAMALPPFLLLATFSYLPLHGWIYAFFEKTHLTRDNYVGLKWILQVATGRDMPSVMINTMAIFGLGLLFGLIPIFFAILLSEIKSKNYKKTVQTLSTLPYFISWILVYSLMFSLFSSEGLVNTIIAAINPGAKTLNVLGNAKNAWLIQSLFSLWKNAGWGAIIYLAAITGIDTTLYEAAEVDGAGRIKKILHITLPGIAETYVVLLLLSIANMLSNGFEQFYVFSNPLVTRKLLVLDLYVYEIGIKRNLIPLGTATGIYKTIFSVTLLFLCNAVAKKIRNGKSII